jgi:hypothetical protein
MFSLSTTLRTPVAAHAERVAKSRSDQLCTVPVRVTSPPLTSTAMVWASVAARRLSAASMSDLTTVLETVGRSQHRHVTSVERQ